MRRRHTLDSESEAAVLRALTAALEGWTALVIAHRLSTVRDVDLILVLDDGRIVEHGRHATSSRPVGCTSSSTAPSSRWRTARPPPFAEDVEIVTVPSITIEP